MAVLNALLGGGEVVAGIPDRKPTRRVCVFACALAAIFVCLPNYLRAQDAYATNTPATTTAATDMASAHGTASTSPASAADVRSLSQTVAALQAEIQSLNSQLAEMRAAQSQSDEQVRLLQEQLLRAEGKTATASVVASPATSSANPDVQQNPGGASQADIYATPMNSNAPQASGQPQSIEDRVSQLEEDQQLLDSKLVEQSQSKVESGSRYRVRFSGIVLFNLFANRGTVDNTDFPQFAIEGGQPFSSASFGASLRQSQLRVDAFGPNIAGARTSASIDFDFAGGFPQGVPNGQAMGIVRLRTAVVRFDWQNTSLVAGEDRLFFAPNSPTSLSMQAVPALGYAGNLWGWIPQVRVEQKISLSEKSSLMLQAGILDSMSGDLPSQYQNAYPSWGEQSGQPAYAARVAWSHARADQQLTIGAGGYYGRQFWGFGRNVDGWAGTVDVSIPLSKAFSLTGAYYRGRAVGALWGAFAQDVLMSGSLFSPTTVIKGLDSTGGWMQLKFKPRENFQINAAYGGDNPFASELDKFPAGQSPYFGYSFTRNQSPFANFIYQIRSDVEVSVEYRRLRTMMLDDDTQTANRYDVTVGYKF